MFLFEYFIRRFPPFFFFFFSSYKIHPRISIRFHILWRAYITENIKTLDMRRSPEYWINIPSIASRLFREKR